DQPLTVAGRLHADQRRRRPPPIERLGFSGSMHQSAFCGLSRLCVQPGNLLPAGMEITPYNDHYSLLLLQRFFGPQYPKRLHGSKLEPSLLSDQSFFPNYSMLWVDGLTAHLETTRRLVALGGRNLYSAAVIDKVTSRRSVIRACIANA